MLSRPYHLTPAGWAAFLLAALLLLVMTLPGCIGTKVDGGSAAVEGPTMVDNPPTATQPVEIVTPAATYKVPPGASVRIGGSAKSKNADIWGKDVDTKEIKEAQAVSGDSSAGGGAMTGLRVRGPQGLSALIPWIVGVVIALGGLILWIKLGQWQLGLGLIVTGGVICAMAVYPWLWLIAAGVGGAVGIWWLVNYWLTRRAAEAATAKAQATSAALQAVVPVIDAQPQTVADGLKAEIAKLAAASGLETIIRDAIREAKATVAGRGTKAAPIIATGPVANNGDSRDTQS